MIDDAKQLNRMHEESPNGRVFRFQFFGHSV
jgi:hypothetical protein